MTEVDILPVADPNIFSQTQRISSLAQTELQLAMHPIQVFITNMKYIEICMKH